MPAPPLGLTARATVLRVIDGDTIELLCLGVPVTVRLIDTWAPETRGEEKPQGETAKAFLESLAHVGANCIVFISTMHARKLSDLFSFGRPIGDIWMKGDENSLGELMVAAGHATREKP